MAPNTTQVVIIGGSYTGTGVAHELLKTPNVKVTLINPSSTFYFNIGAPRVLAKPSSNPADRVLVPIASAFKRYPNTSFEFVLGTVTSVDVAGKSVSVSSSSGERSIAYNYLVIASGSTTPSTVSADGMPFKPTAGDDLKAAITRAQEAIAAATSIVIAGGGPVGVETAGEIAEAYPKTSVTLVSSNARILTELKESASAKAEAILKGLGVKVVKSTKVVGATRGTAGWDVKLSSGETLNPDLYISAVGVIPNSSFLEARFLDADAWVKVDGALRVQGVADGSVYALGDVTTHKMRYMMKALDQIPVVVGNIKAAIAGGTAGVTEYKPNEKLMEFVPIGSKTGTGQIGGFVVFSFVVAMMKGKDYFISKAGSYIGLK